MKITHIIILICVFVFFLQGVDALMPHLVLHPIELLDMPWMLITSMFAHGGFQHIFFNMFVLFMFGSALENKIGSEKFIFLYLIAGVLGAIGFMVLNSPDEYVLGASGAIYGIIGALMILMPNMRVYIYMIPVPMWFAGIGYALIEIFAMGSADNIAHSAHLLGFVAGVVLAMREGKEEEWPPKPRMQMWMAVLIPIVIAFIVAIAFGVYYNITGV